MGKLRKVSFVAGPLVREAIYPVAHAADSRTVRAGKKELSTSAQERMNLKYQWQKLEMLMAANFGIGDLVLTLTFDDKHLPDSRAGVRQRLKEFFKALRGIRHVLMLDVKYIYVIEHHHSRFDPTFSPVELAQQGRYHVHMLINSTGNDYEAIRQCWPFGLFEVHRFELTRDRTYESLARYFCKEITDKPGDRKYVPSKGLKKPEVDRVWVDSSDVLKPPEGAVVYEDSGVVQTIYGKRQFVKFLFLRQVLRAPKAKKSKGLRKHRGKRK